MFVGTHRDQVPDLKDHEIISRMLRDMFSSNIYFWPFVTLDENEAQGVKGRTTMNAFFINNTLAGKTDAAVAALGPEAINARDTFRRLMMKATELCAETARAKGKIKMSWLAAYDKLTAKKSAYIPRSDVSTVCRECGMEDSDDEVDSFLKYFHSQGKGIS
jgi:hypothetical protein